MTPAKSTRFLITALRVWAVLPRATAHTVTQIAEASGLCDLAVRRALQTMEAASLVHGGRAMHDTGGPAPVSVMVFRRGLPGDDSYGGNLGGLPVGAERVAWLFEQLQMGISQAALVHAGIGIALARSIIATGRELGVLCVVRWERTAGCNRGHRAVYGFGSSDAPRPAAVPQSEHERRCRQRKKLIQRGAAGFSVFSAHAFQQIQGVA